MTEVWWEGEPERRRIIVRYCKRCFASEDNFHIVSPKGTGHVAAEYNEGYTVCGIDATGPEWWWRI